MNFRQQIPLGRRTIGAGCAPYIIAEMACAHDGDATKARELVDAAARAGADAIQLQIFARDQQMPPHHDLYGLLGRLELTRAEWEDIYRHARASGLDVFVFTYDLPSLQLALDLGVDGIKLSSADLSNPELIEAAARSGRPFTLGTGASTLDEIADALHLIAAAGGRDVILMHGVQNFPTALEDANIARLRLLQRVFGLPTGYQDHTAADLPIARHLDLLALGLGACVIEKHITRDRGEKGTDYQAALEPAEFAEFVQLFRDAARALGDDEIHPLNESDRKYRDFQKRSIFTARDLPAGEPLQRADVRYLRAGKTGGLTPDVFASLAGKKTRHSIPAFQMLTVGDLAD